MEHIDLAPGYRISRVIKGGWQLSAGHSQQVSQDPVADMFAFVDQGIDCFDCADIYTGVEEMIGRFRAANAARREPARIRVHTKCVPDDDALATLSRTSVEAIIDRSRSRLQQERLDMVQFHWWNTAIPGWIETALWLSELQSAGKLELLSLTNFNAEKTRQILDAGVALATTQVQYSLLDARPEKALIDVCSENGVQLLCYGSLAGGFLSDRWLGAREPQALENRSLIKYRLMIEEVGGWELFQELLATLRRIADRHATSIANVASRWVLDRPGVAAVIIGARNADHVAACGALAGLRLDAADAAALERVRGQMRVPAGDVFDLERDRGGRHGRIMKVNLNAG